MNFNFIKDKFIEKHENIDDFDYLCRYIKFLINYDVFLGDNIYTEKHHILPISIFPEFKNEFWNIINLKYDDHKLVHLWLFKSINIRKYQRPLNWMVREYKNSEEISKAAKRGWEKLKMDKQKYCDFCDNRSKYMKNLSPKEQRRRANIFWENITDDEYINFCNKMKSYWTEEKKMEKSKQMNDYYSNSKNRIEKSKEGKERWDNMIDNKRKKFKEKMNIINKDENKRRIAGDKIKKLWKNDEYLEKMKNRKHKPCIKLKIIKPNGEEVIYKNMKEIINEHGVSPYLIRKYKDSGVKIKKDSLKDCLLESLK